MKSTATTLAIALATFISGSTSNAATYRATAIAHTRLLAPGTSIGTQFQSFGDPQIDSSGSVAFLATLNGPDVNDANDFGIWSQTSGVLQLAARTGEIAPTGFGEATFATFIGSEFLLNNDGKISFLARIEGNGVSNKNDVGLLIEHQGSLRLVARKNDIAPGVFPAKTFEAIEHHDSNSEGMVSFRANIDNAVGQRGIWSEVDGSVMLVALEGEQVPGLPTGTTFESLGRPKFNSQEQTAFVARTSPGFFSPSNDHSLWLDNGGTLELVVREGDVAPGTPAGVRFTYDGFFDGFAPFLLNESGHIAFQATLGGAGVGNDNRVGIWSNRSGDVELIARSGSQAPGVIPGVEFSEFAVDQLNNSARLDSFSQNSDGSLAFWARLTGIDVIDANDAGIWSDRLGELKLVVREGDPVPNVPGNVQFRTLFTDVKLNGAGQLAFTGLIEGDGIDSTNDQGIWVQDLSGDLHLVAREGDLIEFAPGDLRTLESFNFTSLFDFNDLGQLAFFAFFDNFSTRSVIVASPEDTGSITGDFDGDGDVDGVDFLHWQLDGRSDADLTDWQANYGLGQPGDFDSDRDVDGVDFLSWQRNPDSVGLFDWHANYGSSVSLSLQAVPEFGSGMLFPVAFVAQLVIVRRCRSFNYINRTISIH